MRSMVEGHAQKHRTEGWRVRCAKRAQATPRDAIARSDTLALAPSASGRAQVSQTASNRTVCPRLLLQRRTFGDRSGWRSPFTRTPTVPRCGSGRVAGSGWNPYSSHSGRRASEGCRRRSSIGPAWGEGPSAPPPPCGWSPSPRQARGGL